MVDKAKTKREMKRVMPKVTPIGNMGKEPLILPNYSGTSNNLQRIGMRKKRLITLADPTNEQDAATKAYVDSLIRGRIDLFFTNNASDIGTYKDMETDAVTAAKETITQTITAGSTTLIASFASILNDEEIDAITALEKGIYSSHIHASATKATGMAVYFEFYKRTSVGAETLLGTSHDSNVLSLSEVGYDMHANIVSEVSWTAGDRVVAKIYGRNTGGANKNISIFVELDTLSRVEFPAFIPPTFVAAHTMAFHSDDDTYNINTSGTATIGGRIYANAIGLGLDVLYSAEIGNHLTVGDDLTVDTNTLVVDSTNSRVGIGTATPGSPLTLEVADAVDVFVIRDTSQMQKLRMDTDGGDAKWRMRNSDDAYTITFDTDGDSWFDGGNVGIGTDTPGKLLEVDGDAGYVDATDMGATDADFASKKYVDDNAGGAHTIVSHSDTTGTGAELDTLTDGSNTTLHEHETLNSNYLLEGYATGRNVLRTLIVNITGLTNNTQVQAEAFDKWNAEALAIETVTKGGGGTRFEISADGEDLIVKGLSQAVITPLINAIVYNDSGVSPYTSSVTASGANIKIQVRHPSTGTKIDMADPAELPNGKILQTEILYVTSS